MMSRCEGGLGTVRRFLGVAQEPQGQTMHRVLTSRLNLASTTTHFTFLTPTQFITHPQGLAYVLCLEVLLKKRKFFQTEGLNP